MRGTARKRGPASRTRGDSHAHVFHENHRRPATQTLKGRAPTSRAPDEKVAEVIRLTQEPPPHEATHWTIRTMGKAIGLAASTVREIWKVDGLNPHRWRQFKLSNDRAFAGKLHDVVGLYVAPPGHALVLSVADKSQIQALGRF